jgi:hypothetical protein
MGIYGEAMDSMYAASRAALEVPFRGWTAISGVLTPAHAVQPVSVLVHPLRTMLLTAGGGQCRPEQLRTTRQAWR